MPTTTYCKNPLKGFNYNFIMNDKGEGSNSLNRKLFKFKDNYNLTYIVIAEEYNHKLFAVKFYPKSFNGSPYKYGLSVHRPPSAVNADLINVRMILNTCFNICYQLHKDNPLYSFAFIGEKQYSKKYNKYTETYDRTQRYRIYSTLVQTYFKDELFEHITIANYSLFLLKNREYNNINKNLMKNLEDLFYNTIVPALGNNQE